MSRGVELVAVVNYIFFHANSAGVMVSGAGHSLLSQIARAQALNSRHLCRFLRVLRMNGGLGFVPSPLVLG